MKILKKAYQYLRCKHIIKKNIFHREKYDDRNVLEQIIFPHILAYYNPKKILDIGRDDYQEFYNEFFKGRELWTMDIDVEREEFGSPNHHITDDVANVKKYFKENYFDFVLINGVLGWGLKGKTKIEKTFNNIFKIMKSGGVLIIGWNDFEDLKIFKPNTIEALKKFNKLKFPPLKTEEFECCNGDHKYSFYIK